ncbi:unnamed protein product [Fusarium graminearum]|uniref:Uncharacterized protein n=1 Tax=Gibberella zeae TaxID=5518 RepID=A0A9N8NL63_GIBZA|nr:unnamed protein product [Fusarium graminearum]CAG1970624.1 unnamed protein product [Fusarium graminearum]CAG2011441.1 unnamed protein product [Fusarium graminearum]
MQGRLWFQPWALPKLRRQKHILDWHGRNEAYEPLWADSELEDAYYTAIEKVSDFNNLPLWSAADSMKNDKNGTEETDDDTEFDLLQDKAVYTTVDEVAFKEAQDKFIYIRKHLSSLDDVKRFLKSANTANIEIYKKIVERYDIVLLSPPPRATLELNDSKIQCTLPDATLSQAKPLLDRIISDADYLKKFQYHHHQNLNNLRLFMQEVEPNRTRDTTRPDSSGGVIAGFSSGVVDYTPLPIHPTLSSTSLTSSITQENDSPSITIEPTARASELAPQVPSYIDLTTQENDVSSTTAKSSAKPSKSTAVSARRTPIPDKAMRASKHYDSEAVKRKSEAVALGSRKKKHSSSAAAATNSASHRSESRVGKQKLRVTKSTTQRTTQKPSSTDNPLPSDSDTSMLWHVLDENAETFLPEYPDNRYDAELVDLVRLLYVNSQLLQYSISLTITYELCIDRAWNAMPLRVAIADKGLMNGSCDR